MMYKREYQISLELCLFMGYNDIKETFLRDEGSRIGKVTTPDDIFGRI